MRLLIIGTLEGHIGQASKIARDRGAKVSQVPDPETALNALRSGQGADLVMIDVTLPVKQFIESLKNERINVPVVGCGIHAGSEAAAGAIRAGAKEYIPLPPDEELIAAVLEAISEDSEAIIYVSQPMKKLVQMAEQVAPSEANIMITGESGTGKEVLARYIHKKSKRHSKPFISVNCAAIPENLLESELFGHEKGAFTGAVARRIGKFEEASGGTLLLDEISEMDIHLQAKLLRAIQEREIDRVGGTQPVKVDLRILATSNRNLAEAVAKGSFREDLLFRLNVIALQIPPLRERPDDIPVLAEHFIAKYSEANGLPVRRLSSEALDMLMKHSWRGNVRELENTIHRAVLLASGDTIGKEAILFYDDQGQIEGRDEKDENRDFVGRTVADVEKELILETLNHCLGNRTHAANILGISIRTLRNKLKQYSEAGTRVPPPRDGERMGY